MVNVIQGIIHGAYDQLVGYKTAHTERASDKRRQKEHWVNNKRLSLWMKTRYMCIRSVSDNLCDELC